MRKMKYLLIASLIAFVASPALAVEIGGYVDIGIFDIEGSGDNYMSGSVASGGLNNDNSPAADPTTNRNLQDNTGNTTLAIGEVNLDVSADLTDNISVMISMDANSNDMDVAIDKAYVDFVNPGPADITLRIGKAESILGLTARQVESNQIESISHPMASEYTIDNVNGAPAAVQVLGSFAPLNYALSMANATYGRLEDINGAEDGNINENNQMTFAGNLGVVPIEGLEIGIFGEFGANANEDEAIGAGFNTGSSGNDSDHELYGVYGEYAYGPFKVAAEFLEVQEELSTGEFEGVDDNEVEAFYIYGSYDVTSELTAWIRYGEVEFDGETEDKPGQPFDPEAVAFTNARLSDMERFSAGVSYDIADNVTVKFEYQDNDEDDIDAINDIDAVTDADRDDNVMAASLVCSF